jgi:adenine-specific DNA methylase
MAMIDPNKKVFTAEMMLRYCEVENYLQYSKKAALKGFEVIQGMLFTGESAVISFTGNHNSKSFLSDDGEYSYVITEKRLLYAHKSFLKSEKKEIRLDEITNVTVTDGSLHSTIAFETQKESFTATLDKKKVSKLYADIQEFLKDNVKQPDTQNQNAPGSLDAASEIKKFKDLLDTGAITQEEFDLKKKQLLGI